MQSDQQQLSPSNKAEDFQPSTQNPQALGASNLQTPVSNLQPVQSSDSLSGQQLLRQAENSPNLKVETVQSLNNASSIAAPSSYLPQDASPVWFWPTFITAIFVVLTFYILRRIARREDSLSLTSPVLLQDHSVEAIKQTPAVTSKKPIKSPNPKKKAAKGKKNKRTKK